jgi:hypothetical protein
MIELVKAIFDDPVGRWFLYAGIFVFAVVSGLYVWLQIKQRIDALLDSMGVVREQVTNNHTTNLREEADERHDENRDKLDLLVTLVKGQGESIGLLQRGQSSMYALIVANTSDIEALQSISDTKTRAEINKIIGDNHDGKHARGYGA